MRYLLAVSLLFLASVVGAADSSYTQLGLSPVDPFACNGATEGASYQNITLHELRYCNGSSWLNLAGLISGTTTIQFRDSIVATGSQNFVRVVGVFPDASPDSTSTFLYGEVHDFRYLGTNTANYYGATFGIAGANPGPGPAAPGRHVGLNSYSSGFTAGENIGMSGYAQGATAINTGVFGQSPFNSVGGQAIGVAGVGGRGDIQPSIGGLFYLSNAFSYYPSAVNALAPLTSSVLFLDTAGSVGPNPGQLHPLITGRDGGVQTYKVGSRGDDWSGNTVALTDAAAAAVIFYITIPTGASTGGQIDYCIEVIDATPNYQNRCGQVVFTAVNKAGTLTFSCVRPGGSSTLDNTTDFLVATSGTMTDTVLCWDGTGGIFEFLATADSSLTPVTERINFRMSQWGHDAVPMVYYHP